MKIATLLLACLLSSPAWAGSYTNCYMIGNDNQYCTTTYDHGRTVTCHSYRIGNQVYTNCQ